MSDITLSEMPFVLEGDITDPSTQTPLYLIQNGDALTGMSTASDVESDTGSLNVTSVQLYHDIVELQNNQTVLVDAIEASTTTNGSNSNYYTSANLPEYITGNWNFAFDTTFTTIITKNKILFKNDYYVERTLSLDNNIDGRIRLDAPLAVDNISIKVNEIPEPTDGYGTLFIDDVNTLSIMYENGAIFPIFSISGNNSGGGNSGGGGSSVLITAPIEENDYTEKTNSVYQFNYFEAEIFHGLNRNISTPTLIDTEGCYIDVEYEVIDQDNIKIIAGEAITGTLLIT